MYKCKIILTIVIGVILVSSITPDTVKINNAPNRVASPPKVEEKVLKPKLIGKGLHTITYYCPCNTCSEGWGTDTKSGKIAKANHTVAADLDIYPIGTTLLIGGQEYTVEDCGGGVKGKHIDIFVNDCGGYGVKNLKVMKVRSVK